MSYGAGSGNGMSGNPFFNPLLAAVNSDSGGAAISPTGSTAQDALMSLLQALPASSSGGTTGTSSNGSPNGADLASAIALYQSQMSQQMLTSMFASL